MENIEELKEDIPLEVARDATRGTYQDPERVAEDQRREYAETLATDFEDLRKHAGGDQEKLEILATEFKRYREGYRALTLALMGAESRCVSWFISGPANYPARQQEKRRGTAHRRLQEVLEYRERAMKAILRKLQPEKAPIMSSDPDAVERLEDKIAKAEHLQTLMKAANKIVKENPRDTQTSEKMVRLAALGMSFETSLKLFQEDWTGAIGFPGYEITNNAANIRRMKARVVAVTQAHEQPSEVVEGAEARLEDCPADNRVRLFFPGKPDAEIRTRLKRSGFRWTPSMGCWQAYRNTTAIEVAKSVAQVVA